MKRLLAIVLLCVLVPCAYGGTLRVPKGDKYVGGVSNGVAHGQGSYTWSSGANYVGEWRGGRFWSSSREW